MTDLHVLEANVRHLEAELRAARITLWDQMAMAVMSGRLAALPPPYEPIRNASATASDAYRLADAMLAARNQPIFQPTER